MAKRFSQRNRNHSGASKGLRDSSQINYPGASDKLDNLDDEFIGDDEDLGDIAEDRFDDESSA